MPGSAMSGHQQGFDFKTIWTKRSASAQGIIGDLSGMMATRPDNYEVADANGRMRNKPSGGIGNDGTTQGDPGPD